MQLSKISLLVALITFFYLSIQAQEWVSYQSQQHVNDLVDTGDELLLATDVGLVVVDKTTLETTLFDKSNTSLSNNHIQTITKSADGNTWIGTYDVAMMQFDGTDFINATTPVGDINPFTFELYDLKFAPNGDLWIGTNQGVFQKEGDNWTQYDQEDIGDDFFYAWDIEIENNGDVLVGSINIHKFSNGTWSNFTETTTLSGYLNADLFTSSTGDLFVAGDLENIGHYDGTEWTEYFIGDLVNEAFFNGSQIKGFTEDGNGDVYLDTQYNGVFKLVDDAWVAEVDEQTEMVDNQIDYYYIDDEGNRWLNSNIHLSVNKNGSIESTLIAQHTLENNTVTDINKGSNGNLYFTTTSDNHFSVLDTDGHWSFLGYPTTFGPFEFKNDLLYLADNDIWMATNTGLHHYDGTDWTLTPLENCKSFTIDSQGKIYVQSSEKIYEINNGVVDEFDMSDSPLSASFITGIGVDTDDNLWIAESNLWAAEVVNNIKKVNPEGIWTNYPGEDYPAIDKPLGAFHFDVNGNVWIPSDNVGAIKFDGESWSNPISDVVFQLDNYEVHTIESDEDGKVYFSHQYGVTTLVDDEFENLIIEDFPSNPIHTTTIQFDNFGNLWWASSRHGVFLYTSGDVVGIKSNDAFNIDYTVYPNPVVDYTILNFTIEDRTTANVFIYNQMGQLLSSKSLGELNKGNYRERVELGRLPKGFYVIQLQLNDQAISKVLLVK